MAAGADAATVRALAPDFRTVAALGGVGEAAPAPPAMVMAPTVLEVPVPARMDAHAAPAGMGASSVVHVDSHSQSIVNHSVNTNNNID
jgi:hypothetical protein